MKLTKCIILTVLFTSLCSTLWSQENNSEIVQISREFNQINSNNQLTRLELDAEEFLQETPDGGASLGGYFDNEKLVKIRSWIGLSYGYQQIDYYFRHDTLIFAFVVERHFKIIQDSVDFKHTSLALKGRYYFSHNKLIERNVRGSGFWGKEQVANLLPDSKSYYALLQKKKNKGN